MFYEFADYKATVITQLQRLVLATDVDQNDDDSGDVELAAMMNDVSIDADDSLEYY